MKGFWIPIELMELDISWTKRILLAEISQLEMLDKGCIASNSHFAEKLKLSNQAVSKALNELSDECLITIDNAQTKRNFGRKITINFSKSAINFSKSAINFSGESKDNNTFNNTNNTDDVKKEKKLSSKQQKLENLKKYLFDNCKYKSKITITKKFEELYFKLENRKRFLDKYVEHQKEKLEFSKTLTNFILDYDENETIKNNFATDGGRYVCL